MPSSNSALCKKTCFKLFSSKVGEATNWPVIPIIETAAKHVGERIIGLVAMRTDFIWTKLYWDLSYYQAKGFNRYSAYIKKC
jgi:hypothetical protein